MSNTSAPSITKKIKKMSNTDVPSAADALGLDNYIQGLSKFIMTCETPMTVSLQGGWGTGKTTLFGLIKDNLERGYREKCEIIEMNTWQFSVAQYQDNLIYVLMSKINERLNDPSIKDKLPSFMRSGGNLLKAGLSAVGAVSGNEAVAAAIEIFEKMIKGNISDNYDAVEEVKSAFQEAINKHCKGDENGGNCKRLIIFIDDLDRLAPEKAVELLEGIKNFIDCENCVFVLAIDEEVIYEGIEKKFGEKLAESRKQRFFDKIIQVPFSLPVSSYDIKGFIKKKLENDGCSNADDKVIQSYVCAVKFIIGENNPRSIKRIFNLSKLHESFMTEGKDGITIDDKARSMLFALVAFQVYYKENYNELIRERDSGKKKIWERLTGKQEEQKEQKEDFSPFSLLWSAISGLFANEDDGDFETFCKILKNCPKLEGENAYQIYTKVTDYLETWAKKMGGKVVSKNTDNGLGLCNVSCDVFKDADGKHKIAMIKKSAQSVNLTFYKDEYDNDFPDPKEQDFLNAVGKANSDDNPALEYYDHLEERVGRITIICKVGANPSLIDQMLETYMPMPEEKQNADLIDGSCPIPCAVHNFAE